MNIHVSNFSADVSDSDLEALFREFGNIESVEVIRNIHTQESMGYGFVVMASDVEAATAISALNGKSWMGNTIAVDKAKRQHGPSKRRRQSFERQPKRFTQ